MPPAEPVFGATLFFSMVFCMFQRILPRGADRFKDAVREDMIYLDWAASAPPEPAAMDEARDVSLRLFANPSSPHARGTAGGGEARRGARHVSRASSASMPGRSSSPPAAPNRTASLLLSLLDRHRLGGVERQKTRIVTTEIEHSSVYEQARILQAHGISCTFVHPRPDGTVDPAAVAGAVDEHTVLVSVMLVNNETGAVQDVAGIVRAVREASRGWGRRILIHTDAVQALGKIPFSLRDLDVDAASFSGHKIGGPAGRRGAVPEEGRGAGLSLHRRGPGIGKEAGHGEPARHLRDDRGCRASHREAGRATSPAPRRTRARLIAGIREIPGAWTIPVARDEEDAARWSPYIVSAAFPPLPAEVVVRTAEEKGFCISTGAACSSKKKDRTRVPESMGLPPETARCAVRISTGTSTTAEQVDGFLAAMREAIPPLLSISRGRGA